MKKDTKLYKILKLLYLNKDKKFTAREISDALKIEYSGIHSKCFRLLNHVNKEKIDGKVKYWIKPYEVEYIKKVLKRAT